MKSSWVVSLCVLLTAEWSLALKKFPPGFKFGAATSSYQVEGAWNVSDKGESIWDRLTHQHPNTIAGGATGDVACNSYYDWRKDVEVAAEMGLHFYRFSISWPRLLPTGLIDKISADGIRYYDELIDGLLEKGIEPVVTLYHWDLPQRLQYLGGWTNPYVTDWFADYSRAAYRLFGDRVKTWITLNEPMVACDLAFNTGFHAPSVKDPEFANYLCAKNMLVAHAKAWRIYDEEFKPTYHGKVGLTNQLFWFEPNTEQDEELAELVRQYMTGIYSHAIFTKEGGWPPQLELIIAQKSKEQGFARSRLPAFTQEEIDLIRGTYDFSGVNYYTSRTVRKAVVGEAIGSWPLGDGAVDLDAVMGVREDWRKAASSWFWVYPQGLRKKLAWLKKNYGDIEVFITENGISTFSADLDDPVRVNYFRNHLEQVWLAINEDGVNVTGYTAWTMMDNFEWADGYSLKFGLYSVDPDDEKLTRVPRSSAKYYAAVIRAHSHEVTPKYSADELYSAVLFYTPLPVIVVVAVALVVAYPHAKKLTAEHRRLLNVPNAF
ncbi:unnamed protein product, partial [Iphiclides podalirius]